MTTSCSKPMSRNRRGTAPKEDGETRYLTRWSRLRQPEVPGRDQPPAAFTGGAGGDGDGAGTFRSKRARRKVARETLPELLRLVLVAHLVLREARLVEDPVELAVVGIRGEDPVQPALGGAPGPAPDVEVAHDVLVLGEEVAHRAEAQPGLRRVRRVGIGEDELAVRERRDARVRLLAVGALGLLVRALGEAEERVVRARVRRVAVPEVLVPHARLEIAERRLLVEERVCEPQGGLPADRVVRVVLGHEAQVLAAELVFLLLDEGLAFRVGLLLRHREELARHLGRRVRGRAARRGSEEGGEDDERGAARQEPEGRSRISEDARRRRLFQAPTPGGGGPGEPAERSRRRRRRRRRTSPPRDGTRRPRARGPAFASPTPPSTAIVAGRTRGADHLRQGAPTRSSALARNDCPPHPGFTDMTRTKSTNRTASSSDGEGRARVDRDARGGAARPRVLREAVEVRLGLDVDGDARRSRVEVLVERAQRLLDHEVDVEGHLRRLRERLEDDRPDREIRDEPPVHHVEVDEVRAGGLARGDGLAEPREIGREDRGGERDSRAHGAASGEAITKLSASRRVTGAPASGNWRRIVPVAAPS